MRLGHQLVNVVLLIAYHFPPLRGSSGMQRTLRFASHLPSFGWRPIVLSIDPRAYDDVGAVRGNEVPPDLEVQRAFGLNAARQVSLFGRYPIWLALPDRWASWRFWAVPKALRIIRASGVRAIWSTFPIASAHRIGLEVARRARLPWIAEFRDPMWQSDWPPEPQANVAWRALEREIFGAADHIVFTSPSAIDMYAERFPQVPRAKMSIIENGYDEETFRAAETVRAAPPARRPGALKLLHSGIIYRSERDPTHFFAAVAALRDKGAISGQDVQIVLRASGSESDYAEDLARLGISDIVRLEPGVDYVGALQEMLDADGLLLLQAANCNAQIPAKLYEYLRAGRPILALTDPAGDTARTLDAVNAGIIAPLDSAPAIESALMRFLDAVRAGACRRPSAETVARYSREAQAGELARLLDRATRGPASASS